MATSKKKNTTRSQGFGSLRKTCQTMKLIDRILRAGGGSPRMILSVNPSLD